jgi:hypothetical protein
VPSLALCPSWKMASGIENGHPDVASFDQFQRAYPKRQEALQLFFGPSSFFWPRPARSRRRILTCQAVGRGYRNYPPPSLWWVGASFWKSMLALALGRYWAGWRPSGDAPRPVSTWAASPGWGQDQPRAAGKASGWRSGGPGGALGPDRRLRQPPSRAGDPGASGTTTPNRPRSASVQGGRPGQPDQTGCACARRTVTR